MIDKQLENNIAVAEKAFADWGDLVKRRIPILNGREIFVCYIDDLADRSLIEDTVLRGLVVDLRLTHTDKSTDIQALLDRSITTADIKYVGTMSEALDEIMAGNALLMLDGFDSAVIISAKGFPKRGVEKPENEVAVQGPKEAFCESIRVNTVLIRRRIRDTSLRCKQMQIGRRTKTDIAVMYLDDCVRDEILAEAMARLNKIDIEGVFDSGYIEQCIQDSKYSPFPQVQLTERPDKVAAELTQGRIAIVVDTSPFVILIPTVLASLYQASEDYYQRWEIMSLVRIIRYIAGFFALALPGLYLAVTLYHPSMIASELAFKIAGARSTVPIPSIAELLFMELAFEALREAGIRLPSAIGSTLGIVGGIIVGQSAVDAGLVSPMVVIVVALTGICSFAIPNLSLTSAYRLVKYLIILLSAVLGLYGWFLGILCTLIHLCSLKSFGVPYIYPFASAHNLHELKDSLIRAPLNKQYGSIFKRR